MSLPGWILIAIVGLALFGWATFEIGKRQRPEHPTQADDYFSSGTDEANHENANKGAEPQKEHTSHLLEVLLVIFTALLAVGTGLLWLATRDLVTGAERIGHQQVQEMKKSNAAAMKGAEAAEDSVALARRNIQLDQRAWVAPAGIEGVPEVGKEFQAVVTVKNTGRTFAKNLKFRITHETIPAGQLPTFSEDTEGALDKVESVILLPPDGLTGLPTVNDVHAPIAQGAIDLLRRGELTLFIHGRMTYEDIFGCAHWTTFCYRLLPENFRYRTYETHNDTDDNQCPPN